MYWNLIWRNPDCPICGQSDPLSVKMWHPWNIPHEQHSQQSNSPLLLPQTHILHLTHGDLWSLHYVWRHLWPYDLLQSVWRYHWLTDDSQLTHNSLSREMGLTEEELAAHPTDQLARWALLRNALGIFTTTLFRNNCAHPEPCWSSYVLCYKCQPDSRPDNTTHGDTDTPQPSTRSCHVTQWHSIDDVTSCSVYVT